MPKRRWEYEALDGQGKLHNDIVWAHDYREVIEICVKKGFYPRDIRELSKQAAANYGQIPKLKKLKRTLEAPPKKEPEFASMSFNLSEELPNPKLKLDIDWLVVGFIVIILVLILASQVLKAT